MIGWDGGTSFQDQSQTENSLFAKSISPESNNKLMRFKRNDHQLKKLLIDKQILFVSSLGHLWGCIENSVENIYTDVSV